MAACYPPVWAVPSLLTGAKVMTRRRPRKWNKNPILRVVAVRPERRDRLEALVVSALAEFQDQYEINDRSETCLIIPLWPWSLHHALR